MKTDWAKVLTTNVLEAVCPKAADMASRETSGDIYLGSCRSPKMVAAAAKVRDEVGVESDDDQDILLLRLREGGYQNAEQGNGMMVAIFMDITVYLNGTSTNLRMRVKTNPTDLWATRYQLPSIEAVAVSA